MGNIVTFTGRGGAERELMHSRQLELFGNYSSSGAVTFIDVDFIRGEELLNVLSRNSVKSILDFRKGKMFSRTAYIHKDVSDYISAYNISYIDAVESSDEKNMTQRLTSLQNIFELGLCVILFKSSENHINITQLRQRLFTLARARVEVPSRSL